MGEPQPSKLVMRVRFPSSARDAPVAQRTEQEPSKLLVEGSNPSGGAGGDPSIMVAVAQLGESAWLWSRRSRVRIPSATPTVPAGPRPAGARRQGTKE